MKEENPFTVIQGWNSQIFAGGENGTPIKAIAFEKKYTILERRKYFLGDDLNADHIPEITWYGNHLGNPAWDDPEARTLCYRLVGKEESSEPVEYHLFFIFNTDFHLQPVTLPPFTDGKAWHRVIDTSLKSGEDFLDFGKEIRINPPDVYLANPRSTVVFVGK